VVTFFPIAIGLKWKEKGDVRHLLSSWSASEDLPVETFRLREGFGLILLGF
jgi:hypothetical protein